MMELGLTPEQALALLNLLLREGRAVRLGRGAATRYRRRG
jgi:ATP-dependent DNA helicase RecG